MRAVPVYHLKGGKSQRLLRGLFDSKQYREYQQVPFVEFLLRTLVEHVFKNAVEPFHWSVHLGVVGSGSQLSNLKDLAQTVHNLGHKVGTLIHNDLLRYANPRHPLQEFFCYPWACNGA